MPKRAPRRVLVVLALALGLVVPAGTAHAGGPGVWTKLATVDNGFDTVGMLRTSNGDLHVVYLKKKATNDTHAYGTVTLGLAGGVASTGTALSGWDSLEPDPRLVKDGTGLRLLFEGATGSSGCFSTGLVYTETSSNGSSWNLPTASLSSHSAGIGGLAATAETNGTTPVAAFAGGHFFHEGVDNCPASNTDGTINQTGGGTPTNPAMVTDPSNGSVWVAWYQSNSNPGYWVDQILPSQAAPKEAPGSDDSSPKQSNQPNQPVALAARAGGGVYEAYCVATSTKACAHVDLWKAGTTTPLVVPDTGTGNARHVALAAGPGGRVTVLWYDTGQNRIHAIGTNTAATGFGLDRVVKPPPNTSELHSLQAEGTSGRLDVVVDVLLSTTGFPITLWSTQILAGLKLTASPTSFSHTAAHTVTFTVKDAGQAVSGAHVACIGKSATTNSNGVASITFPKGTATGKHVCTATKANYNPGKVTITVT
ncbi:MAG: hypothetical protein ACJ77A_00310 [Actinomycetota bacterium]